jgi:competence protein ComEA
MKPWHYLAFGVLGGLLAAGLILLVASPPRGDPITLPPAPTPAPLTVDISGAVTRPGVYQLPQGSRVQDAIEAAGGFLENAYATSLNLAMPLSDGTKVLVPAVPEPAAAGNNTSSDSAALSNAPPVPTLININTATAAQLMELPGIGETKAAAIISYRENNGPFTTIEQIMNVSGIGPATFESLKDLTTVY